MQASRRRPASETLVIHFADNVAVALVALRAGERRQGVTLRRDIPAGHKFALCDLAPGEQVIKHRFPIGRATEPITAGDWVHTHNCAAGPSVAFDHAYRPAATPLPPYRPSRDTFAGYARTDGRVGIRNELWILPATGCLSGVARRLAAEAMAQFGHLTPDGIHCFAHSNDSSPRGGDHENTRKLLAALARHPNAGGVLVLEYARGEPGAFRQALGAVDEHRVKFLDVLSAENEIETGLALLAELASATLQEARAQAPVSKLVIGLKCGGSDRFSGITANPLLGAASDALGACGASAVLTEVPEMFGAEALLMNRCRDVRVFAKTVALIDGFKRRLQRDGWEIHGEPSPDDREEGITTPEERSLGCTQKGGIGPVTDALAYAGQVTAPGLNLLCAPGDDPRAVTALAAAGCQLILFATGEGLPLSAPVPMIKVSSTSELAARKPHWIDFDAGPLMEGVTMVTLREGLLARLLAVAEGQRTRSEENGCRDLAIFQDGIAP